MAIGAKIASKTAGLFRGASKALEGLPGVFHHLAGAHEEAYALMQSLETADPKGRADIFPDLRALLVAHARAEEEAFYPDLLRFPRIHDLTASCLADHARIEQLLRALHRTDTDSPEWQRGFKDLQRTVLAHAEREEEELFPQARELLREGEAEDLLDRFRVAEKRELARLSR